MPLISCPECQHQVSDTAYRCNHCGYRLRQAKRGTLGQILKWLFIAFNLLMAWWLISYWGDVGTMMEEAGTEGGQTGMIIGSTMATGMILTVWALGDIILGSLVYFTRAKER